MSLSTCPPVSTHPPDMSVHHPLFRGVDRHRHQKGTHRTMTTETTPPPIHWVDDQARAWRLVASILEHDGVLFDSVVAEARDDGPEAIDKLLAALARNLVLRLRMAIGLDTLNELVTAELLAALKYQEQEK
jgi:hypothetical protein